MVEPRAVDATGNRPRAKLHLTHVEGLRALAALTVYVNHAYAQTWEGAHPNATEPPFVPRLFMVFGHLAVSVFIVISGFCLTLPVVDGGERIRDGTRGFFKRRMRRILPPYYGALFLSLVLIFTIIGKPTGTLWDVPIHVDWQGVVAHLVLVQDFFRTGRINYVLWSIAVEWHIYFLFPLLVLGARRFGIVRVALAALAVGYFVRIAGDGTRLARPSPQYLGLFTLGMFAAYVVRSTRPEFERVKGHAFWGLSAGALLLGTLGLTVAWGVPVSVERFHYLDLPVGLMAMATLVHTTASRKHVLTRILNVRALTFIGTFSYSLYLVHAPLLQVLWQYALNPLKLGQRETFTILMTVGLGAVLGSSYVFFRVFEEPFMRSQKRTTTANSDAKGLSAA